MPRQERRHHLQRAQLLLPLRQPGRHPAPRRVPQHGQKGPARPKGPGSAKRAWLAAWCPCGRPPTATAARPLARGCPLGPRGGPSALGCHIRGGALWHSASASTQGRAPHRLWHSSLHLPPGTASAQYVVAYHGSIHLQAPQVSVHPVRRCTAARRAPRHAPRSGLLSVSGPESPCEACAISLCPAFTPAGCRIDHRFGFGRSERGGPVNIVGSLRNMICPLCHERRIWPVQDQISGKSLRSPRDILMARQTMRAVRRPNQSTATQGVGCVCNDTCALPSCCQSPRSTQSAGQRMGASALPPAP